MCKTIVIDLTEKLNDFLGCLDAQAGGEVELKMELQSELADGPSGKQYTQFSLLVTAEHVPAPEAAQ